MMAQGADDIPENIIEEIRTMKVVDLRADHVPDWYVALMTQRDTKYNKLIDVSKPPPWLVQAWKNFKVIVPAHLKPPQSVPAKCVVESTVTFETLLAQIAKDAKTIIPSLGPLVDQHAYLAARISERKEVIAKLNNLSKSLECVCESYVAEQIRLSSAADAISSSQQYINELQEIENKKISMQKPTTAARETSPIEKVAVALHAIIKQSGIQINCDQFKAFEMVTQMLEQINNKHVASVGHEQLHAHAPSPSAPTASNVQSPPQGPGVYVDKGGGISAFLAAPGAPTPTSATAVGEHSVPVAGAGGNEAKKSRLNGKQARDEQVYPRPAQDEDDFFEVDYDAINSDRLSSSLDETCSVTSELIASFGAAVAAHTNVKAEVDGTEMLVPSSGDDKHGGQMPIGKPAPSSAKLPVAVEGPTQRKRKNRKKKTN